MQELVPGERIFIHCVSCAPILSGTYVYVLNIQPLSSGDADKSNSTLRYLPVMINRLLLSLRKAADTPGPELSLANVTNTSDPEHTHEMQFVQTSGESTVLPTEEDIPLATVSSTNPISSSGSVQVVCVIP